MVSFKSVISLRWLYLKRLICFSTNVCSRHKNIKHIFWWVRSNLFDEPPIYVLCMVYFVQSVNPCSCHLSPVWINRSTFSLSQFNNITWWEDLWSEDCVSSGAVHQDLDPGPGSSGWLLPGSLQNVRHLHGPSHPRSAQEQACCQIAIHSQRCGAIQIFVWDEISVFLDPVIKMVRFYDGWKRRVFMIFVFFLYRSKLPWGLWLSPAQWFCMGGRHALSSVLPPDRPGPGLLR